MMFHMQGPRVGIEFSDGRAAVQSWMHDGYETDEQGVPIGPVLMPYGGGGNGRQWHSGYWCFPLPSPGELARLRRLADEGDPRDDDRAGRRRDPGGGRARGHDVGRGAGVLRPDLCGWSSADRECGSKVG